MIEPAFRNKLLENSITLNASNQGLSFVPSNVNGMKIETPIEFRAGVFDIDNIGAFTYLGGGNTVIKHTASIGRYCSIAGNISIGATEHETESLSAHPMFHGSWKQWKELDSFYETNKDNLAESKALWLRKHRENFPKVVIGNNVWIGEGVFIRRGVKIGNGAIIAAHSVVTKDVLPYSIVSGTTAQHLKYRYKEEILEVINQSNWWEFSLNILDGIDFDDMDKTSRVLLEREKSGNYPKLDNKIVYIKNENRKLTIEGEK